MRTAAILSTRLRRCERGQAAVELVAVVPFVLLIGALLWQLVLTGHTLWLCANAARVAARAEAVGGDAEGAARSALPAALERGLLVERGDEGEIRVQVDVPLLAQGLRTPVSVAAGARMEAGA